MNKLTNGWTEYKLKDLCVINYGKGLGKSNIVNGNIPVYSSGGIIGFHNTYNVNSEGVIIGRKGNAGSVFYSDKPFFCIDTAFYIEPNNQYDLKYLFYKLVSMNLKNHKTGTAIPGLIRNDIYKLSISIPPLDEQKRIASALSKIDAYLENTIKLIEEKERFKRGIAKKLLTCKEGENIPEARFKGFEDEWEIVKLGDIGTITATGVDKKINDNETPIKLLNYLDVFNRNKLYEKEISYMTTATEKQLEKCNIRKGDLFITPSSEDKKGIAKSSVAMEDFKNTVYSYHIIRVRFNKEIDLKFKSYMCDTDFFHRQAYRLCDGSGQRYFIKLDNFRNMEICIPKSIKEQEKIGGYLSLLDKEIDNLKKQKELIKEMKRGAMQKLLSGEVRLLE